MSDIYKLTEQIEKDATNEPRAKSSIYRPDIKSAADAAAFLKQAREDKRALNKIMSRIITGAPLAITEADDLRVLALAVARSYAVECTRESDLMRIKKEYEEQAQ